MRRGTIKAAAIAAALTGLATFGLGAPAGGASAPERVEFVRSESVAGRWEGAIKLPGSELGFNLDLVETAGVWSGDISIPAQGAKDLPLEKVSVNADGVTFAIAGIPGNPTFNGKASADGSEISGSFTQGPLTATFSMKRGADPTKAAAEVLDGFGAWLEEARSAWKAPGVSVAIVRGGKVVYAGAAGNRDVQSGAPMTPDTLLAIGSTTKAFTTAVLGTLEEEGKLDWDAPVRRVMPDFAIGDEDASRTMTAVDLVTHRSGMPRHDLMWYNSAFTRAELFARLRHLPSNKPVRAEFQYNNLMYLSAGVMIERLTGGTWEDAVRTRIFQPLGMTRSVFSPMDAQRDADVAVPYREEEEEVKRTAYRDIGAMGPAGSIYSSANEMAKWVAAQLGAKDASGKPLLSESTRVKLHSVHMHVGGPPAPAEQQVIGAGYALGWFVDAYRGHRRVHHGGNIDGFSALVTLFPDDDMGMVVLTNMNGSALPGLVARHAADRMLALERVDWNAKALAEAGAAKTMQKEAAAKKDSVRKQGTNPAHPVAEYAGAYEHPGYGVVRIKESGGSLALEYNRIGAPLAHWHYEVFSCGKDPDDPTFAETKVMFLTGMDGEVDGLRVSLEPSVDPITFRRLPDEELTDPSFLERLAGEYQLGPQRIVCELRGDTLWSVIAGQPPYELAPRRRRTFELKGMSGFSVRFDLTDDGAVKAATFIQPNGVFTAMRVK